MDGYFLYGSDEEMLMVIRGYDEDAMFSIIQKLKKSREENIKKLAEILENHFYERDNVRRGSIETGPKDKKNGGKREPSRNSENKNSKPFIKRSA
jgi:hypothetical protein